MVEELLLLRDKFTCKQYVTVIAGDGTSFGSSSSPNYTVAADLYA